MIHDRGGIMAWLILIIAMLGWSAPGFAQTKASDKEWNAVVEAAKKEGKVVVAGSPDPVTAFPSSLSPAARVKSRRGSKPSAARAFTALMFISPGPIPRQRRFTAKSWLILLNRF